MNVWDRVGLWIFTLACLTLLGSLLFFAWPLRTTHTARAARTNEVRPMPSGCVQENVLWTSRFYGFVQQTRGDNERDRFELWASYDGALSSTPCLEVRR